jgi:hypothetical protein
MNDSMLIDLEHFYISVSGGDSNGTTEELL